MREEKTNLIKSFNVTYMLSLPRSFSILLLFNQQRSISDYFLDQDKNAHGSTGAAKAESRMSSQVTSKKNSISTGSSSSATTSRSTTDPDCVTLG